MAFPHKSQKITATIERWFAEQKFKPGDRFPSDQALAQQFKVNHLTVRAALRPFVQAGLLERRVGSGTVVRAGAEGGKAGEGGVAAGAVGVALPDGAHHFYADILGVLEGTLLGTGRPLLLGFTREMAAREQQVVEAWLEHGVRHMILAATIGDAGFYSGLIARGVRLVLLDRQVPGVAAPSVTTRDHEGVQAVVRHLVQLGHRRIVHLSGTPSIWTAQVRRDRFQEAAAAAGLSPAEHAVVSGGYFVEDGYRATLAMLADGQLPDAIFAANDPAAVGAIRALTERGIGVPEQVSVVGYGDDLDLGRNFGLTTVRQFPEQMGLAAVQLVLGRQPLHVSQSVEIRPELVIRTSSAPRRPTASGPIEYTRRQPDESLPRTDRRPHRR